MTSAPLPERLTPNEALAAVTVARNALSAIITFEYPEDIEPRGPGERPFNTVDYYHLETDRNAVDAALPVLAGLVSENERLRAALMECESHIIDEEGPGARALRATICAALAVKP